MFYRPENGHGLPHNPFNAIVSPRPIGWISTRDAAGAENLAPYSFFNAIAYEPPQVMFASTDSKSDRPRGKDTLANIEETGVFCINIVSYALRDAMNTSSGRYGREVDEFALAGLERAPCLVKIVDLLGVANAMVIGEVTGVYMDDACLNEGRFDITRFTPLARMGYQDYAAIDAVFAMPRPTS